MPCFILYSKAKFACYSGYFLTSYFCIPVSYCWRRNETPTLQSGLNLYIFNTCFLQLLYFISLAQQPTGQAAKHYDLRLYSAQAQGEINFTLTYLLQLRLCFGELPYQLRIRLSQGLLLLRNQRNILVCKKCSFPMGTNRILS